MAKTEPAWQFVIWRLCGLSGNAREKYPTERWRFAIPNDEEASEEVAYELNRSVLDSLEDIGIYLTDDPARIFLDDESLSHWLDLLDYIVPTKLYPRLRDEERLKIHIEDLLSGSLTDGDLLHSYLDWLRLYNPDLKPSIDSFYNLVRSTDTFSDYLAGQITLINEEKLTHKQIDIQNLSYIQNFLKRLKKAFDCLKDYDKTGEFGDLDTAYKEAETDITKLCSQTDFTSYFGWWLSVKQTSLPQYQRLYYIRISKRIHVQIALTRLYRVQRDLPMDRTAKMLSFLFNAATKKYILSPTQFEADDNFDKDGFIESLKRV